MNNKASDKWDIVKWCGKIIKYAFGVSKWHFLLNISTDALNGLDLIGLTSSPKKQKKKKRLTYQIPLLLGCTLVTT